jgi:signal transduction histidine kinase
MKSLSRFFINLLHSGETGFVAVALASYFSAIATIGYVRQSFTLTHLFIFALASLVYLVAGTYGFAWVKRKASVRISLLYFAIQITLAATIIFLLSSGAIFLIMLPLAGQSAAVLPFRWTVVVCLATLLILIVPLAIRAGPLPAVIVGLIYFAALVFVVVFVQVATNERNARAEVERLAAELREANDKLREYAAKVEELATTKERNRLAREIHDSLGHYLTVINVQLEAARAVLDVDAERAREVLSKAQALTQDGLNEVRRSVATLRTSPTENRPLTQILSSLADECHATGIATQFVIKGEQRLLSPQAELTLYRTAQEGLTNVRKHAQATSAKLTIDYLGGNVLLLIEDDGVGCVLSNEGFGLLGIRERVQLLGGKVCIRTAAGEGFKLEVEIRE